MPSASRVNWAKFRVSVVCIVATTIVATLVYLLTGGTLLQKKATVYLYLSDATGLAAASPVRVDGIDVGKVSLVELSGSYEHNRVIKVTMRLERDRLPSIPVDSFAQLSSDNLIGDKFVDVTSGKSQDRIQPNGEILFKEQAEFMKSLDLRDFEKQLRDVDVVLTDIEQGRSRVGQFVLGNEFYNDLRQRMAELQTGMRTIASTTSDMGKALYSDQLYRQIAEPLVALDRDLARLQSGQGQAGQLLRDNAQYDQLQASAQGLTKSIGDLRASEFVQSDRMYEDWNRNLVALIRSVQEMNANPMIVTSETYDNLNGLAKELSGTIREFREDPRKFLRLKVF